MIKLARTVTASALVLAMLALPSISVAEDSGVGDSTVDDAGATWLSNAIPIVMSYDFLTGADHVSSVEDYFTTSGFVSFSKALKASRNIEGVIQRKLTATAALVCPPIRNSTDDDTTRRITYDFPLTMTYASNSASQVQNLHVKVIIEELGNDNQFGIDQLVARPSYRVSAEECVELSLDASR